MHESSVAMASVIAAACCYGFACRGAILCSCAHTTRLLCSALLRTRSSSRAPAFAPPMAWSGFTRAYDVETRRAVGGAVRLVAVDVWSALDLWSVRRLCATVSFGSCASSEAHSLSGSWRTLYEHAADGGSHRVLSGSPHLDGGARVSARSPRRVLHATVVTVLADDGHRESCDLSSFLNERIWSFDAGVPLDALMAALVALRLVADEDDVGLHVCLEDLTELQFSHTDVVAW